MVQPYNKQSRSKNAAQIGFDFANVADAYAKLEEELAELQQAIKATKLRRNRS